MFEKFAIPISIVAAGALIAGALYFVQAGKTSQNGGDAQPTVAQDIRGVQKNDYIRGNPNAKVVLVEFSDTECPFCKQFHTTLKRLFADFGKDGEFAWVYRPFPLEQLHPKAVKEAHALLCAGDVGGQDAFWKYTDRIYEVTPANNGLDEAELPKIAQFVGIDVKKFETCMASNKFAKTIEDAINEAAAAGGRGTPHSIIISGGEQIPVEGAQPYEVLKGLIETLLEK